MRRLSLVWISVLGCYRPEAVPACALSCTSDVDCPQGNLCGSDQRCFPAGGQPCDQIDPPTDGPPIDGPCETFGRGLLNLCLVGPFDAAYSPTIEGEVINTDLAASCTHVGKQTGTNAPDLCVRAATTITIDVTQTITGIRPYVLVAVDTLTIDTNGALRSRPPPDMAGKYCPTASDGPTAGASAGGGAGGSFGGRGGNGGASDANVVAAATSAVTPSFVRGGCPGGRGGVLGAETRTPGGYGGGAIGLLARGTVAIAGFVDAAGGGGQGGATTAAGGGGGGSGGMIVVDAQNLDFKNQGYLLASGGGGGAGFGSSTGADGGAAVRNIPLGLGGVGANGAGSGGNGSGTGLNGNAGNKSTTNDTGAGGGGGGAGWIRFYSETSNIDGNGIYPPLP